MCGLVGLPGPAALRHVVVDSKADHENAMMDRYHRSDAVEVRRRSDIATVKRAPEDGVRGVHTGRVPNIAVPEQNRGQEFAWEESVTEAVDKQFSATPSRAWGPLPR